MNIGENRSPLGPSGGVTGVAKPPAARERRRHDRLALARACKLRAQRDLRYQPARTRDISAGGALLELDSPRPLAEGQSIAIAIDFAGRSLLTQEQVVEAKVVRAGPVLNRRQTVAVAFRDAIAMPGVAAVA